MFFLVDGVRVRPDIDNLVTGTTESDFLVGTGGEGDVLQLRGVEDLAEVVFEPEIL